MVNILLKAASLFKYTFNAMIFALPAVLDVSGLFGRLTNLAGGDRREPVVVRDKTRFERPQARASKRRSRRRRPLVSREAQNAATLRLHQALSGAGADPAVHPSDVEVPGWGRRKKALRQNGAGRSHNFDARREEADCALPSTVIIN